MKKLLCVVPALLLFAMIGAPNARADSYTATFACTPLECANPPATENVTFPAATVEISYPQQSNASGYGPFDESVVLPTADAPTDTYIWFIAATYVTTEPTEDTSIFDTVGIRDTTDGQTASMTFLMVGPPVNGYPTVIGGPAFVNGEVGGPLTFSPTSAATPEPAPLILMLLGLGLLLMIRKRAFVCKQQVA